MKTPFVKTPVVKAPLVNLLLVNLLLVNTLLVKLRAAVAESVPSVGQAATAGSRRPRPPSAAPPRTP
ncbi:hypothetical protein C4J65_22900 [Streptomyces sp. CB09001]|nr:hypothetical protein C4J65_22900 [Streptomyces sp. CB09001]